ncbi:receptor-like protein 33 [Salvia miltiorrhiza]|uniref:receptor-like protein 33 n=1 Tax=Salvia miltiorrhiza TaxID=226208 RepID=UPI0025ABFE5E|nr:receptor-like protein 33 [Salvia miltiorrhiza]
MELDLGRNNITGAIPDNFPPTCVLSYLDLNRNSLQGRIPKSLQSCELLEFMNVGDNIIYDTFPCMLPSTLRVLVLQSNKFHGEVRCRTNWPDLQIVDISSNNFSGSLESINFSSWTAMTQLRHESSSFYTSGVILTVKGLRRELGDIWSDFGTIDFSSNNFRGRIPNAIGDLITLRHLNFSHNAFNGTIPTSFGQLSKLESLDLSRNQVSGVISPELGGLTFLSFLNLSYNKLVGQIPNGPQLRTFTADSFKGNPGLCGFNDSISCSRRDHNNSSPGEVENGEEKREIEWTFVFAALGYVVGLGIIVWLLLFCRSFRVKYFGKIEEVVEDILVARDRRRARNRARTQ